MKEHAHQFPITKMSQVFKVSRSGYYRWLNGEPSRRSRYNQGLGAAIRKEWKDSKEKYGSPRIHRGLLAQGWKVSRPRVARLMRAMGIASRIRRKWVKTTDSSHTLAVAPNLLDRQFFPSQLGQVWVSDITYLPGRSGWLYLTTVMDLADRQIIGWALSQSLHTEVTSIPALQQALIKRPGGCDLFHSDRGVQYVSTLFRELLSDHQILQSMSRKGNCWDNAPAESFFKTLKYELDMPDLFADYQQAKMALFEFIEIWYNRKRRHSALNYLTPAQAQHNLNQQQTA